MQDQIGRHITLNKTPKRIVSLVPSQTELLADLGLEQQVVGITKFCIHPKAWRKEKTIVGGTKQQRLEVIHELNPDLIIANKEENDKVTIEKLAEKYPVFVSDVFDLPSALDMIMKVGLVTATEKKAKSLIEEIASQFELLKSSSKLKVAYAIWKSPWMWAGSDTFIHEMLEKAGLQNLIKTNRYPEESMEEIIQLNPDYILLSSEPYPFSNKHIKELELEYPNQKFMIADGEMFSWYGSRLLKAPAYFQSLLKKLQAI